MLNAPSAWILEQRQFLFLATYFLSEQRPSLPRILTEDKAHIATIINHQMSPPLDELYCLEVNIQPKPPLQYKDIRNCLANVWENIWMKCLVRVVPHDTASFTDQTTGLQFGIESCCLGSYPHLQWYHVVAALKGLMGLLSEDERAGGGSFGEFDFVLAERLEGSFAKGYVRRA